MRDQRVVIIGAGIGGLVAAVRLAARGLAVTVVERANTPGGKMRQVAVGKARLDAGPTVLTLRRVFEAIFAEAGDDLSAHVALRPAGVLARHAWTGGERLDLFADIDRSADAIAAFAGPAEARGYRAFVREAAGMFRTLDRNFIQAPRGGVGDLVGRVGLGNLGALWGIRPFDTLWRALGDHFRDPRLRQLFGRYATYCGSSPFQAPATLMLVAHVEQDGVWLVEGGMHRLAVALAALARRLGATFRFGAEAMEVLVERGAVAGVRLADGGRIDADAVVLNADVAAVAAGLFGPAVAGAAPATPPARRSLSAVTWTLLAETAGFALARHTVFFSRDYRAEFDDILRRRSLPREPTVYVCAQDRDDRGARAADGPERLFVLVNAPATGDTNPFPATEIDPCETRTFALMERCGLRLRRSPEPTTVTTPADFHRLFPGTGGALYGPASHGWRASFRRAGARTAVPGLYLAGGSTHPGPGVPMAALSGRMAADSLIGDLERRSVPVSTVPSRATAMRGGTSTR